MDDFGKLKKLIDNILPALKKYRYLDYEDFAYFPEKDKDKTIQGTMHKLEELTDDLYWVQDKKCTFPDFYAHIWYKKYKISLRYLSGQGTCFQVRLNDDFWNFDDAYQLDKEKLPNNFIKINKLNSELVNYEQNDDYINIRIKKDTLSSLNEMIGEECTYKKIIQVIKDNLTIEESKV